MHHSADPVLVILSDSLKSQDKSPTQWSTFFFPLNEEGKVCNFEKSENLSENLPLLIPSKREIFDIETWGLFILIAQFPYFSKFIHKLITSEDTLLISYSECEDKMRW